MSTSDSSSSTNSTQSSCESSTPTTTTPSNITSSTQQSKSPTSPSKRARQRQAPPQLNIHSIQANARSPEAVAEAEREKADDLQLKKKREQGVGKRRTMPEKCSTMPHISQLAAEPKAAQH